MRLLFIYSILLFNSLSLMASTNPIVNDSVETNVGDIDSYYQRLLWLRSQNASGLSLAKIGNFGHTAINAEQSNGDYYRIQEGDRKKSLSVFSERFQKIDKNWYVYGRFQFNMGRQYNRSWSDVIRTYNSNPYIYGSSVKGNYDFQNYAFLAKIATAPKGKLAYGAQINYEVTDLSRLKDPRSRTLLADYSLIPSISYELAENQHVGLSVKYRRRKEKTPNVTTVQTDPNLKYYAFKGVGNVEGTIGAYSSFKRQFVDQIYGIGLDYHLIRGAFESLSSFEFDKGKETVYGTNKQSPGVYRHSDYSLSTTATYVRGKLEHRLSIVGSYTTGAADEYKQIKITDIDQETGITSISWENLYVYKKQYKLSDVNANANYKLALLDLSGLQKAFVEADLNYSDFENKYTLPFSSLNHSGLSVLLKAGFRLFSHGQYSLWLTPHVGSYSPQKTALVTTDDNEYVQQVLLPDVEYYKDSYLNWGGEVKFVFPTEIRKKINIGYLKLETDQLHASSNLKRHTYFFTLGLLTK